MFKLGLIVNPLSGIGGSVALKGSDGVDTVKKAFELGAVKKSPKRAFAALEVFKDLKDQIEIITCPAEMGEDCAKELGFNVTLLDGISARETSPEDTKKAAEQLVDRDVDLILFAGGDGTARDICSVVEDHCPVLGIPAGVKIHSGVYCITPKAAGEVVALMVKGQLVDVRVQDVRDIDEDAFRQDIVKAKYFGEMKVPQAGHFVQNVKQGGVEVEELVLQDIAADIVNQIHDDPETIFFIGSGKTTQAIMDELGLENTLLGVDAVQEGRLIKKDLTAKDIMALAQENKCKMVISVIGGQGHIFGRGNQQFTPEVIRQLGKNNITVISTKSKITSLEGRPLIVDSGDSSLDEELSGHLEILTGYEDTILYPVA